jgi:hypothetical protein
MPTKWSVGALFAYGLILAVFGVMVAGAGHGSYFLLWLAGSPFSVFGISAAMIASILQWGILALAQRRRYIKFQIVVGFLLVHYIVAMIFIFGYSRQVDDWEYLRRAPGEVHLLFALGLTFYVIGQCFVWGTSLPKKLQR